MKLVSFFSVTEASSVGAGEGEGEGQGQGQGERGEPTAGKLVRPLPDTITLTLTRLQHPTTSDISAE